MVKDLHPFTFGILGFVLGLVIFNIFLKPETETIIEYKETRTTDTVYVTKTETILKTEFKYIYERDTIIENYQPKIRAFKELYPFTYGNVSINGEILGELRYINVSTDFKIPQITNVISKETTKTIIKKPKGIYGVVGSNTDLNISIGATYLNDKSLIGYEYQPQLKTHYLKVGWKLF